MPSHSTTTLPLTSAAYAIYAFFKIMENFLESVKVIPDGLLARKGEVQKHMFPFCCMAGRELSKYVM